MSTMFTSAPFRVGIRHFREGTLYAVAVDRIEGSEYFLTCVPPPSCRSVESQAKAIYDSVARFLEEHDAEIFQERLWAPSHAYDKIREVRSRSLATRGFHEASGWSLVGERTWQANRIAGLQIHAATGDLLHTFDMFPKGSGTGRILEYAGARLTYLHSVVGTNGLGKLARGPEEQAQKMFENAQALLTASETSYTDVVRTWLYMPRILEWYREFNQVRTDAYTRFGVFDSRASGVLPASTGIQGGNAFGAECLMDVLAVTGCNGQRPVITRVHNPRQNEATSYGSSFSRAVEVKHGGLARLYISGTASINGAGETTYLGDVEGQIFHTLTNVAALLSARGAELDDICHAVAFFKEPADIPAFESIRKALGIPSFPVVNVVADICRDDLLFELEPVAVYAAA